MLSLAIALSALALTPPATAAPAPVLDAQAAVSAAASATAGRPVELRCESAEAVSAEVGWALAYVVLDGSSVIHLGPTACGWLAHPESPTFGEGLMVVIHEALHLATNDVDESRVNCAALAAMPDVATRFFGHLPLASLMWGARRVFDMTPDTYRQCEEG